MYYALLLNFSDWVHELKIVKYGELEQMTSNFIKKIKNISEIS